MQAGVSKIEDAGAVLWGVNIDSVETLKEVRTQLDIKFPLLSDAGAQVINAYGIRNKEKDGTGQEGLAIPMTLIIDKDGVVKDKLAHEGVGRRHGVADILAALEKVSKEN